MRYGPSLASGYLSNGSSYRPSEVERDTCPDDKVDCDGLKDCKLGSDETNCGQSPPPAVDRALPTTNNACLRSRLSQCLCYPAEG